MCGVVGVDKVCEYDSCVGLEGYGSAGVDL